MLKLTMNLPAEKKFFPDSEGIVGVKIRFTDDSLQLRPVSRMVKAPDFVPLTTRARGGVELLIDGDIENKIADVLTQVGRNEFFYLNDQPDSDWLSIIPYDGEEKYPPRQRPHLRAWNLMDSTPAAKEGRSHDGVLAEVRKAVTLVAQFNENGDGADDKPTEVTAAEAFLSELRGLLTSSVDLSLVAQARDILNSALDGGTPSHPRIPSPTSIPGQSTPDLSTSMGSERAEHEETQDHHRRGRAVQAARSKSMQTAA